MNNIKSNQSSNDYQNECNRMKFIQMKLENEFIIKNQSNQKNCNEIL